MVDERKRDGFLTLFMLHDKNGIRDLGNMDLGLGRENRLLRFLALFSFERDDTAAVRTNSDYMCILA